MKILLSIVLTITVIRTYASELTDVYSIPLVLPVKYDKKSSFGATVWSKAKATGADLININIQKIVDEKLVKYKKDLAKYYPKPGELDALIKTVVQGGIQAHLKKEITDDNLISFYQYLGKNLVGEFNNRILEVEGVKDPKRRAIWVDKLIAPFNSCISTSLNSQTDANHCLDALSSAVTPNAGLGVVYELSSSLLSSIVPEDERSKFNLNQVEDYRACIGKPGLIINSDNVVGCALNAMRNGINYVTDIALTKTIKEKASSPDKANAIKKAIWPAFSSCTAQVSPKVKAKYEDQFFNCIDTLVTLAGSELVFDKVSTNDAAKKVMSTTALDATAKAKSSQFKKCAEEQSKKGDRQNGILNIAPCETQITNEVTYLVVSETLKNTAKSTLKKDPKNALQLGNTGVQLLNQCWNNKQSADQREACLRKTITTFSGTVAEVKLNQAIPSDMPGKADLNKSSVDTLKKCLSEELPDNISESKELTKKLDGCTGKLTRSVALKVADHQIRETAQGNVDESVLNNLVDNLVNKEFATCIGNTPTDDQLDACTVSLTAKASKTISEVSFTKEVNAYLKSAGGLKDLGLTQSTVDSFLVDLKKSNSECIDKKPVVGAIMDQVNSCIKGSIKKIAFFFGEVQFNKSVGNMYAKREAEKTKFQNQLKSSLSECLSKKDGKEFSIGDYTKNLYTCSDSVSKSITLNVGKDQIDSSLDAYLKDRPGINLKEKRDSISSQVLGKFNTCMSKEPKTAKCIDALKKEATGLIVLNYGRTETKVQLTADTLPEELKPVEEKFSKCVDTSAEGNELTTILDKCTENFALDFARALGTLKLNYLLKQALGTTEFDNQKSNINASLKDYNKCLDELKKYSMSEGLTEKLSICTDKLTRDGMNIVRGSLNNWMTTEQKDAATVMIKQEFSHFLPCLSALLPSSPYSPLLEKNIDSSIKALAMLISNYIEYNPENARETLDGAISRLSVDLTDITKSKKAKQDLLDFLYEKNGLDQFLKSAIRGSVQDGLVAIPTSVVPQSIRDVMLKKEVFEDVFNTPEGSVIKKMVMDKILRPSLIDGLDPKSPIAKANLDMVKDAVINHLVAAPKFGDQVVRLGVQHEIDNMKWYYKLGGQVLYGKDALKWDNVRDSKEGKKAEAYIKEYILLPKFKATVQTDKEKEVINEQAKKLVQETMEAYKKGT